jgi:hypothetical protein
MKISRRSFLTNVAALASLIPQRSNAWIHGSSLLYTGQLATRSFVPQINSTSNKQMMSRSRHISRTTITSLAIVVANWYVSHSTLIEVANGGPATITASVEYPAGTFTQIKFGGSASGTLPDMNELYRTSSVFNPALIHRP